MCGLRTPVSKVNVNKHSNPQTCSEEDPGQRLRGVPECLCERVVISVHGGYATMGRRVRADPNMAGARQRKAEGVLARSGVKKTRVGERLPVPTNHSERCEEFRTRRHNSDQPDHEPFLYPNPQMSHSSHHAQNR
jgi:hypothetical protein